MPFQKGHPFYGSGKQLFKKGNIPWNKGEKRPEMIGNTYGFKKGQASWNKGKKMLQISGIKHHHWKGGKRIVNGYLYILMPKHPYATKQGYVKNAKLVLEKKIGRYLKPFEIIHHLNENTLDDRPENLSLCKDRAEHCRIHQSS